MTIVDLCEQLFPELAESEDERIRKSLINFLTAIKIISESGRTSWAVRKEDAERCKSFLAYLERQKEQKQDEGDFTIYHPQKNGKGKYECIPFSFYGSLTSFTNDRDLMDFLNESFYDKEECERWCEMENEPELPEGKHKIVDEIAQDYVDGVKEYNPEPTWDLIQTAVCYGANWQMKQFEKNRLANCDAVSKEECDRETDFAMEIIEKEHRQPTFNDAINYGMRLQKEQKPVPIPCGHENGQPADYVFSKQEYESHPIISTDTTSVKPVEFDGKALLYTADKSYQIGFRDGVASVEPAEWSKDYREEDIQTRFAFYTYEDDPSVLYLSNVFVEESSRNHGFGTKILAAAEKVAETIGATTICLKVKQDSPANAWYRKNGYGYVAFEDGYDWLEKNLEYMKPNKQEWSEEDERRRDGIIQWLREYQKKFNPKYDSLSIESIDSLIDWLKSLRPSWKPSEEQMEALKRASVNAYISDEQFVILASLYKQLKKLM